MKLTSNEKTPFHFNEIKTKNYDKKIKFNLNCFLSFYVCVMSTIVVSLYVYIVECKQIYHEIVDGVKCDSTRRLEPPRGVIYVQRT